MKSVFNFGVLSVTGIVLVGCADATRTTLSLSMLPIVDAATPAGLQIASNQNAQSIFYDLNATPDFGVFADATDQNVKTGIEYLFDTTYPNINGDNVVGFFRSAISVIDSRAATEGASLAQNHSDKCTAGTAYTPAITAMPTATNLTVYPACTKIFTTGGSNIAGAGSGYAYGETTEADGTITATSWLTLVQSNGTDKFAMMGKITNAGSSVAAEKGTEVMFMEAGPSGGQWNRHTLYHIIAKPATKQYELAIASTSAGVMQAPTATSDVTGFGCGMQMVSNGEYIRAKGRQVLSGTCSGVADGDFDVCLKASDLTIENDTACADLSFTMTAINSTLFDSTTQAELAAALMVSAATSANQITE